MVLENQTSSSSKVLITQNLNMGTFFHRRLVASSLLFIRILEPLGHFLRSPTASQSRSSSAENNNATCQCCSVEKTLMWR